MPKFTLFRVTHLYDGEGPFVRLSLYESDYENGPWELVSLSNERNFWLKPPAEVVVVSGDRQVSFGSPDKPTE